MNVITATYCSPLGLVCIESDGLSITGLRFCNEQIHTVSTAQREAVAQENAATKIPVISETLLWLDDYFAGKRPCNVPRLNPQGTPFQQRVWLVLLTIPYGETLSYGEIAKMIGCRSAQAVGQAVGANPIALILPCHRVIAAHGKLGEYEYGIEIKKRLLELETEINIRLNRDKDTIE